MSGRVACSQKNLPSLSLSLSLSQNEFLSCIQVDARVFAENSFNIAGPGQLIVAQDHYILRMLYSQGIDLDALGRYPLAKQTTIDADTDRKIWQVLIH